MPSTGQQVCGKVGGGMQDYLSVQLTTKLHNSLKIVFLFWTLIDQSVMIPHMVEMYKLRNTE